MNYEKISLQGVDATGKQKNYTLSDFKGEKVVLYFYPKDETSLCTKEACAFRDKLAQVKAAGKNDVRIIGVSPDSVASHRDFQKKEALNFVLLSDPERKLAKAMGVSDQQNGFISRTTFLVDENGKIIKKWSNVTVDGHADDVMESTLQ